MVACGIKKLIPIKRRSSGKRRSRIMSNLHKRTHKKKSTRQKRKHSRGRGRKRSRKRRKHSLGRGRKRSRKRRKHSRKLRRKYSRNVGSAPKLNGYVLRDVILGNIRPSEDILLHIPEMEILHHLLSKFHRDSIHGYNLAKRKEIYSQLLPKSTYTDEETHSKQKKTLASIIKDLEAMGLKTPTPPAPLTERQQHKLENIQTDMMMGLGGIN